jgi:peptidoglycan/xylan/chitin deacetylase (PgdA/CDA1 family)
MMIRLDRFTTLYIAPLLRPGVSADNKSIPVLMYHSISDEEEEAVHPYFRITTSRAAFFSQMKYLYQNNYETCTPQQAADSLNRSSVSSTKRVVITFDDGYRDFYREAFPILNQFKFTASVFLPTGYIGDKTIKFKSRDCLTWSEINELQRYGITFGSHTITHPRLRGLNRDALKEEVTVSKITIEEKTGTAVETFCYPFAFPQTDLEFKKMLRELLCQAGYRQGFTTMIGRADASSDQLFFERLPVNSCDDAALFRAKLLGAYDWVAKPQKAMQFLKAWKQGQYHPGGNGPKVTRAC